MTPLSKLLLVSGLAFVIAGCDGTGDGGTSPTGGIHSDDDVGYLVIGNSHAELSDLDLDDLRSAAARTSSRTLNISGQRIQEQYLQAGRSYFAYSNIDRNSSSDFELTYYGEYQGRSIPLLRATGRHTFKSFQANICRPSRDNDCDDEQQSNQTSESVEQQLELSQVFRAYCDADDIDNLTELYYDTDPCDSIDRDQPAQITSIEMISPNNATAIESAANYGFAFNASADTVHSDYVVRVYAGESNDLVDKSNDRPVLGTQGGAYQIDAALSLHSGQLYNWRVYGLTPELSYRQLSAPAFFRVEQAVPVFSSQSPSDNAVKALVSAQIGHSFHFRSSTDQGVHEYRLHLTDISNLIDYGYKRVSGHGSASGGSYTVLRNLGLRQGARHRWYVTANSAAGDTLAQTPTREFSIESANYGIDLSSPAHDAEIIVSTAGASYPFAFSSDTNEGIDHYRVYVSDTSNSTDYGYKTVPATAGSDYLTNRNISLAINANHRWYVTANDGSGAQLHKSAERRFKIVPGNINLDNSDARNTATRDYQSVDTGHRFYFSSSSDAGVSNYRVYVQEIDGSDYSYMNVTPGSAAAGVYTATRKIPLRQNKNHRFYVTAVDNNGNELSRSAETQFTINALEAPVLTLLQPALGAEVPWANQGIGYELKFSANDSSFISHYRVFLRDLTYGIDFDSSTVSASDHTVGGVVTMTLHANTNSAASHTWQVQALDASGDVLAESAAQGFSIVAPTLTPVSPLAGATVAQSATGYDFTFNSSFDIGVSEYRLYVFDVTNNSDAAGYKTEPSSNASGSQSHTVHRNITLGAGTEQRWSVGAYDANGFEMTRSDPQLFSVSP